MQLSNYAVNICMYVCTYVRVYVCMDVLQTYALHQHVSFPTHVHGHWLDLFITRSTSINIKATFPTDGLSHHHLLLDLLPLTSRQYFLDHHCVIIDLWLQVGSRSRKKLSHFDQ